MKLSKKSICLCLIGHADLKSEQGLFNSLSFSDQGDLKGNIESSLELFAGGFLFNGKFSWVSKRFADNQKQTKLRYAEYVRTIVDQNSSTVFGTRTSSTVLKSLYCVLIGRSGRKWITE